MRDAQETLILLSKDIRHGRIVSIAIGIYFSTLLWARHESAYTMISLSIDRNILSNIQNETSLSIYRLIIYSIDVAYRRNTLTRGVMYKYTGVYSLHTLAHNS